MSKRTTGEARRGAPCLIAATGTKKGTWNAAHASYPRGRIDLRPDAVALAACSPRRRACRDQMKRAAEWALAIVGVIAISYLALYVYATITRRNFQPGDPIHIFRRPDAPNYSAHSVRDDA
jgi:hypothetical protein